MSNPIVGELIDLLQLERLEDNLFRGQSRDIGTKYVFGGQVLGQALSAAQQTVDPARAAHSLHAYFLRAGDIEAPIVYNVERARDGGSFSVRRVVAIQHGEPIFNCSVSFQIEQSGIEHAAPMPVVPTPDELPPRQPVPAEVLAKLPTKLQPGSAAMRRSKCASSNPRISCSRRSARRCSTLGSASPGASPIHPRCIVRCLPTPRIST